MRVAPENYAQGVWSQALYSQELIGVEPEKEKTRWTAKENVKDLYGGTRLSPKNPKEKREPRTDRTTTPTPAIQAGRQRNTCPTAVSVFRLRKTSPQAQWKKLGIVPRILPCVPLPAPGAPKSRMVRNFTVRLCVLGVSL